MKNLKVAYLLGSLNRGGTETLVYDVLRSDDAPFDMLCLHRYGGAMEPDYYALNRTVVRLTPKRCRWLSYLMKLRRLLKQQQVDIVHAQQSLDSLYASLATMGTNIKVVETFHGYDFGLGMLGKLINRLSIYLANAVCFVSVTQKDYYTEQYALQKIEKKMHVVYNGIDFCKFDKHYACPDFMQYADVATKTIRLVAIGNFVSVRSQIVICRALHLLRLKGITDFEMFFVGRRDEKESYLSDNCVDYCNKNSLTNVHFVGGRADVPAILQYADVFVYSSDHDTFGIAVVEAMAVGVPVMVNDWGVMKEIMKSADYPSEHLWETANEQSLADLIENVICNIDRYKHISKHSKPIVRQQYSIDAHICQLSKVYSSL